MTSEERWRAERSAGGPLVTLTISTRVPSKWLIVDRETGDEWEWRDGAWRRPTDPALR